MQIILKPMCFMNWTVALLFHQSECYEINQKRLLFIYLLIYSVPRWDFTAAIFLPYTDKVSEFVFFVLYWQNNYIINKPQLTLHKVLNKTLNTNKAITMFTI